MKVIIFFLALALALASSKVEHRPVYALNDRFEGTMTWYAHAPTRVAASERPRFQSQKPMPILDDHSPMMKKGFRTFVSEKGQVRFKNVDAKIRDVLCVETGTSLEEKDALAIKYSCRRSNGLNDLPRFVRGNNFADGGAYSPGKFWNGGDGNPSMGAPMYGYMGLW